MQVIVLDNPSINHSDEDVQLVQDYGESCSSLELHAAVKAMYNFFALN